MSGILCPLLCLRKDKTTAHVQVGRTELTIYMKENHHICELAGLGAMYIRQCV